MKLYELDLPENVVADTEDRSKINPSSSFFEPPRDHAEDPKPSSMSGLKVNNKIFPSDLILLSLSWHVSLV